MIIYMVNWTLLKVSCFEMKFEVITVSISFGLFDVVQIAEKSNRYRGVWANWEEWSTVLVCWGRSHPQWAHVFIALSMSLFSTRQLSSLLWLGFLVHSNQWLELLKPRQLQHAHNAIKIGMIFQYVISNTGRF